MESLHKGREIGSCNANLAHTQQQNADTNNEASAFQHFAYKHKQQSVSTARKPVQVGHLPNWPLMACLQVTYIGCTKCNVPDF
jgi:hypothetical protein